LICFAGIPGAYQAQSPLPPRQKLPERILN
jgi:hypothetical protein